MNETQRNSIVAAACQAAAITITRRPSADPEQARSALDELGSLLAASDELRDEALTAIAAWIPAAQKARVPITAIAELTGLTRQTVYDLPTRRAKPASPGRPRGRAGRATS